MSGDALWSSVKLLLDGSGSTYPIDSSSSALIPTTYSGSLSSAHVLSSPWTSTTSIIANPGVSYTTSALSCPSDFTLDFWLYLSTASFNFTLMQWNTGTPRASFGYDKTTNSVSLYQNGSRTAQAFNTLTVSAWNYIVIQVTAANGVQVSINGSAYENLSGSIFGYTTISSSSFSIGGTFVTTSSYIQDVRLTLVSGGRYPSPPSVPTGPLPIGGTGLFSYASSSTLALGLTDVTKFFSGIASSSTITLGFNVISNRGAYSFASSSILSYGFSGTSVGPFVYQSSSPLAFSFNGVSNKWPAITVSSSVISIGILGTSVFNGGISGTIIEGLPSLTGTIFGDVYSANYGSIVGALPPITGSILGTVTGIVGSLTGALPAIRSLWGRLVASLPPIRSIPVNNSALNALTAYAMNTKNTETTTYSNFNFLTIVRIGANYYGVKAGGMYLINATTDNGAIINASFTTAESDLEAPYQKRVRFLYADTQNQFNVMTIADRQPATGPYLSHPTGLKAKLSHGLKGKIWQFQISNVAGNNMRVGSLDIMPEDTYRRIK